jgi:nitrite reductase/ring-hydroxylating ferredoxin subunit
MIGMPHIEIRLSTLKPGIPVRIENGCTGIVVIRGNESVSAFEDACPHAQWRLSDGEVCAAVLECPGHGWQFDTESGRCLNVPAYRLRRYEVTISDGAVLIESTEASNLTAEKLQHTQAHP